MEKSIKPISAPCKSKGASVESTQNCRSERNHTASVVMRATLAGRRSSTASLSDCRPGKSLVLGTYPVLRQRSNCTSVYCLEDVGPERQRRGAGLRWTSAAASAEPVLF